MRLALGLAGSRDSRTAGDRSEDRVTDFGRSSADSGTEGFEVDFVDAAGTADS
ncbi:hypothetical protein NBCG_02992 [Nocardioidaceae bacterium Broad-1]|nr:hypothetical protein NBCG_02992 [Nocardioidaceae bacterium Broad-1]